MLCDRGTNFAVTRLMLADFVGPGRHQSSERVSHHAERAVPMEDVANLLIGKIVKGWEWMHVAVVDTHFQIGFRPAPDQLNVVTTNYRQDPFHDRTCSFWRLNINKTKVSRNKASVS